MTSSTTSPALDVDAEVAAYVALTDKIDALNAERENIKARLRTLPAGKHETTFGVCVSVSPPSRSFNLAKALTMLTDEQRALCVSPDAKLVKGQLPPVLLDTCMEPGKGEVGVSIK